ncbi:Putative signal peptide peptidase SppA [Pirellulimonas nuda]|uniref:Signal peptide peptidase SppA n=1 Tax=Pirellulimonas nuda TaxID=2528009 RepID=A0A518D5W9_9BACT|nr:signal peptide peptidase SppA [Pirellulimonas nuda]QDU86864.1 Putative signal peptide peptidase SppA [Pirellulimonas nuda]
MTPTEPQPRQVIIQERTTMFGRFGKLLLIALGICLMVMAGMAAQYQSYFGAGEGPDEKYHSLSKTAEQKIAIIAVDGSIMEGDDFVKKQIDRVREDKSVKGVVLRINSPGGTVTYSDYLYHHLNELREDRKIPVVVSMGSLCASGGYYIAMAAAAGDGAREDVIFAEPTTWTGSIGVIIPHYDLSGLLGSWKVEDDSVASGPLKQMGSPTKEMTPEEREILQTLVDQTFNRFKEIVAEGRPKLAEKPKEIDEAATGQIFTAQQAETRGLVDQIGFVEDAIARTAELAGVSASNVRCVKYERKPDPLSALLGASTPLRNASGPAIVLDTRTLIDLAAPRAWAICTWAPAIAASGH